MLLAGVLTLTTPFASQAKMAPLYVPLVPHSERPLEELTRYRARCEGFDVDVQYRVERPVGSTMVAINTNGLSLSADQLASLNTALKDRFITGVSTGFCYIQNGGKAKTNLWLEVDAVGSVKDAASHIILNITGDQMNLMFKQLNREPSTKRR